MFRIPAFIASLALALPAALNVPLDVVNWADAARAGEPVTAGLCLPSGAVYDLSKLRVTDGSGNNVPAQFRWLSRWWWERQQGVAADPSVKWVLCDFQAAAVPAKGRASFTLKDDNAGGPPSTTLSVTDAADKVTVSTGPLVFTVSKLHFNLFDEVRLNGRTVVASSLQNGGSIIAGDWTAGECVAGTVHTSALRAPERVIIEEQGPMKALIRVEGRHYAASGGVGKGLYGYQVYITAYAGKPYVDVQWALTNTYMEGTEPELGSNPYTVWVWPFKGYSLGLNLNLNANSQSYCLLGKDEISGSLTGTATLLQKRGSYTVTGGTGDTLAKGGCMITDGALGVMVAQRDLGSTSPKAMTLSNNKISLEFFPDTGGFHYLDPYSRRNHRLRFEFFSGAFQAGSLLSLWKKTDAPLRMLATDRAWYRDCRAWDRGFGVPSDPGWNRLNASAWTRMNKPSATDWVNYSEAGGYNGGGDHWNLTSGFWSYMLRGNPADFEFAEAQTFFFNDMVNVHTSYNRWQDVSYYALPEEHPPLSYYSAHHSPEFRYEAREVSFPGFAYHRADFPDAGHMPVLHVLEYYLLTGDPATRDAVESHGVKGVTAIYYYIYKTRTEPADPESILIGANRGVTRPIIVANHAYEITGDDRYFHPVNLAVHGVCAVSRRNPAGYLAEPWNYGYTHNIQGAVNYWCANNPCSTGTQAQVEASIPKGYTMSDFQMGIAHTALYGVWQATHDEHVRDALIFNGKFQEWSAGKKDTVDFYGNPVQYTGFQYSDWCDFLCEGKRYSDVGLNCSFYSSNSEALGGLAFSYMVSGMDQLWQVLKDGAAGYPADAYSPGGNRMEMKILNLWEAVHRHDSLDHTPPAAVTDLSAEWVAGQGMRLTWTAPTGDAAEYQVKYGHAPIVDFVKRWDAGAQTGWPDLTQPIPHTDSALNAIAWNYTATKEVSFWGAKNVTGEPGPGAPGSGESFLLTNLPAGTPLYFALVSYDSSGNVSGISNVTSAYTGAENGGVPPGGFGIGCAYPNPFNPSITIRFQVAAGFTAPISLRIYDTRGRLVRTLISGALKGGAHRVVWDGQGTSGRPAASGMYLCRLSCGKKTVTKNILLVK